MQTSFAGEGQRLLSNLDLYNMKSELTPDILLEKKMLNNDVITFATGPMRIGKIRNDFC